MKMKQIIPALAFTVCGTFVQAQTLKTGLDKKNMDLTQSPGKNFYEFANGGWMKSHPLTPEFSRYGTFDELAENNQKRVRELIEEIAKKKHPQGSLEQKIGDLYNLAMDSARRNREGIAPIKANLERIAAVQNKKELQYVIALLSRDGGLSGTFMGIGVGADLKNSKMNLVAIGQGGLSLGQRDYYLESDAETQKILNGFKEYVSKIFQLTGDDKQTADTKRDAVLKIETALAKASSSEVELRDPESNYHKMSYAQLLSDYPAVDWSTFFLTLGYPSFKEISVGQPKAIKEVENILTNYALDELKAYVAFHLVDGATSALSDAFRNASFDFYGKLMSGRQEDRPLWKRSISAVEGVLGEAIGQLYVQKYFPAPAKQRMETLVKNLQTAFGERIRQQTWMSDATKQRALEKLNAFYVKIGYPNKWRDYSGLTIDDASYLANLNRAAAFEYKYSIDKNVNKPVDRDEWLMTPQTVNAYYNPTTNEICFPAGILQYPFFDMTADDAFNYGAIGVVIGHEMTHGFDDQGRQFDKEGNLKDWWEKADGDRFKARAKVMSDFFSKIEVLPGLFGNGALTLGENLADHGGLNIAFQAFQNATKSAPLTKVDGFTPEQRFFLAYSGVWAGNIRDEQIRVYTKSDPHSLGRWRVNGALPHIDAWYKAFNITKKDTLFIPKNKRVDVW